MADAPEVRLWGHHGICLHFLKGEGYSPELVTQLAHILKKAEAGIDIELLSGADDVCHVCPYLQGEECRYTRYADPEIRVMDKTALDLLKLTPGEITRWPALREKISLIFHQWSQAFCRECDWKTACEKNEFFKELADEETER